MPVVARLANGGFPVWYDRGIGGGEEWDAVLERKIEDAGLVLIFLSRGAIASKYCRREIKFADAIDKPLLAVTLEPVALADGLKFTLQHLQQISIADTEFDAKLERSVRSLLSRSVTDGR